MWLPNDDDLGCAKEQTSENMCFRSSSPPFEGGESLCELYLESPEQLEKSKSLQISSSSDHSRDIYLPNLQNNAVFCANEDNFVSSLLNHALLPANAFTQTFLQSILVSVDSADPVVANAWMETLLDVIDLLPKEIIKGEILTLAINKGQMSQPVSSRLLCCKMLGKICIKFDTYIIMKEILPVVLSLCQDVDFEVRGYMCKQLDIIAKGIGLEATKNSILPELVELANDEENFVRLAAIETVVLLIPLIDNDTCTQIIIPLVKKFCENAMQSKDSTLPVVAKQLGRLCHGLSVNFTLEQTNWFLGFFQSLAKLGLCNQETKQSSIFNPLPDLLPESDHKDRYQECRCACAYNFPAMVLFVGVENFEKDLYACFKELCIDPFPNVRQTVASGFYEITKLLTPKASILLPELVLLLQDDSTEVLKGLIPWLMEILKAVCTDSENKLICDKDQEKKLIKALVTCEEVTSVTSNWRLHADFLSRFSCLPSCISSEVIFTTFVPLLFVKLHTARPIPCRTAAVYSLLVILRNTPSLERRRGIINELIRELCYARSCHKRMLFIKTCELVIELFSKIFFKLHFFKPLLNLSSDPVPNIRLRLCAILPSLKGLLKLPNDRYLLQQLESSVKTLMTDENDKDVSSAVNKAIEELDKIEVATNLVSRRASCFEFALDMEDRFKENEERQQLELEFNNKILTASNKSCSYSNQSAVENASSNNKIGKIPVLKNIKKERRISSPNWNIDVFKSPEIIQAKEINEKKTSIPSPTKNSISKCSIPVPRKEITSSTHTWPRQKRASVILKGYSDRCPSPMPRQSQDQNRSSTCQVNVLNYSFTHKNTKGTEKGNETNSGSIPKISSVRRKICTTPLPSPETMRKSATLNCLHIESKIPTPFLKSKSAKGKCES